MSCKSHQKCLKTALSQAENILKEHKIRFTPLRREVLTLIWESHRSVKAYDLIQRMSTTDNQVKPSIVYRILDVLLAHHLIHKLNKINSYIGCRHALEHQSKNEQCIFLICEKCEEVEELDDRKVGKSLQNVCYDSGFEVRLSVVETYGRCNDCSKKAGELA